MKWWTGVLRLVAILPAAADDVQHVSCKSCATPCDCADGFKCANMSTSKGVKNRQDAPLCCCPSSSDVIFAASPAICNEVKKCTYDCCLSGQKLCGDSCCTEGQKCISGQCKTNFTTTAPPPPPPPGGQDFFGVILRVLEI
eukprot:s2275_g12.t1